MTYSALGAKDGSRSLGGASLSHCQWLLKRTREEETYRSSEDILPVDANA